MALIARNNEFILIAAKREILVYSGDKENYSVVKLPVSQVVDGIKSKQTDSDDATENVNNNQSRDDIIEIQFADDKNYLVIFTKLKEIFLYSWTGTTIELKFVKYVPRVPSAVCFSPDSSIIVVADKTGDCYSIQVNEVTSNPTWILGHLSMVLDVLFTADGNFVITSDRDEKIRVTRYPKSHIIENYCLGHAEYVSSIKLLPHSKSTLISVSGDLKLKVWNYLDGIELNEIAISTPGYRLHTKQIDDSSSIVALITYTLDEIFLYKFSSKIELIKILKFPNQVISSAIFNDLDADLLVALLNCDGEVEILKYSYATTYDTIRNQSEDDLNTVLEKHFKNLVLSTTSELSLMFKKKFDNVKEYHEKKRKRIEGKN